VCELAPDLIKLDQDPSSFSGTFSSDVQYTVSGNVKTFHEGNNADYAELTGTIKSKSGQPSGVNDGSALDGLLTCVYKN
jgi:hypothetical protein